MSDPWRMALGYPVGGPYTRPAHGGRDVPQRLRPRRRLRRRLPRGHRADRARRAGHRRHPRHRAPRRARRRARAAPRAARTCRRACTSPSSIPASARRAARWRCAARDGGAALLVGPDNGLLWLAAQRFGGVAEAVDIGALAAARWSRCRPRSTAATSSRRSPRTSRPARALAQVGEPLDPATLVALELPARAGHAPAGSSPTCCTPTATATSCSTPSPTISPRAGLRRGAPVTVERRARARTRRRSPTSPPASCCSTRTPTAPCRSRSTAARRWPRSACALDDEILIAPVSS